MSLTAFILADGLLAQRECKTAHGLILGNSRYAIHGVIDQNHAGQDAGLVFSKQKANIPVYTTIDSAITALGSQPNYCIIGVAPMGGKLSTSLVETITHAISLGMGIIGGLHTLLSEHPTIAPLAKKNGVELIDIRKPKSIHQLSPWTGEIQGIKTPRIAVLGMDCAIGKRTTTSLLLALCQRHQISAEMIYTGQTGWLQGMNYGFILDSTLNDFVSGEMEHAILKCVNDMNPSLILLEGQSSLRNPSGPCGAEFICSAGARHVILQHSPKRTYFTCDTNQHYKIPDIMDEIALINCYGADVIAITLNSEGIEPTLLASLKEELQQKTKRLVVCPREEGVDALLPLLTDIIKNDGQL